MKKKKYVDAMKQMMALILCAVMAVAYMPFSGLGGGRKSICCVA